MIFFILVVINVTIVSSKELGQRSWYSNSLWAGWFGDQIPVGARFSVPVQTNPGAHPASYTMGTGSFLQKGRGGVKRPGRGIEHPHHLASRLKKEQSYTTTPPLGLRGLFQGELYLLLFPVIDKRVLLKENLQTCNLTLLCQKIPHCSVLFFLVGN